MSIRPEDICPRPDFLAAGETQPLASSIHPSAVYRCHSPDEVAAVLDGRLDGFVYSRDGHPNAALLGEKCRQLHGAERAVVCGSGMAAISAALLATARSGSRIVVSRHLYGQSLNLLVNESARLGMTAAVVDCCDLSAVAAACRDGATLIVAEIISNPLLRVVDVRGLSELALSAGARLLIDNTFAGPAVFRPLEWGAHLVHESLTKIMNGHSDVLLGLLCGGEADWERVPGVVSAWGLSAAPFDCWLAARGLGTLALRTERANANAWDVARRLQELLHARGRQSGLAAVHYPGLPVHPDHELARGMFGDRFGTIVTIDLVGGRQGAEAFIAAGEIPFCPSLGDLSTTLSHPQSTSHRKLAEAERLALGITPGMLRLSIGIESPDSIFASIERGLAAAGG